MLTPPSLPAAPAGYERQLKRTPLAVQATTSAILWGVGDVLAQRLAEKRSLGDIDKRRAFLTMAFGASFMGPVGACACALPAGRAHGPYRAAMGAACMMRPCRHAPALHRPLLVHGPGHHGQAPVLRERQAAHRGQGHCRQRGARAPLRGAWVAETPSESTPLQALCMPDNPACAPHPQLAFYAFGSHAIDQTGWSGFKEKMDKDFWSTYLAELMIWPAFQVRGGAAKGAAPLAGTASHCQRNVHASLQRIACSTPTATRPCPCAVHWPGVRMRPALRDPALPACPAPPHQTFNFIKVPLAHQLLAVNLMTLVDASFLSWARSQDDWCARSCARLVCTCRPVVHLIH